MEKTTTMNAVSLLGILGKEPPSIQIRKIHSAFFLAQSSAITISYSFALERGYVRSDQLDQDLIVLYRAGFAASPEGIESAERSTGANASYKDFVQFLLNEDDVVLEAAATVRFFEVEGLGDPSSRLRWFKALPQEVRERAATLKDRAVGRHAA